jgi:hypothetical protein
VALAVARLVSAPRYLRGAFALLALALAGFAVHASFDHGKLRDRDGGRPMFEPDVVASAHATAGLVFVDTDHGFALGHDPNARARDHVVVARLRNDDRDRLLYDRLDRPPTWLYRFETSPVSGQQPPALATPSLVPWAPPGLSSDSYRFEAEAEWPPLEQHDGFAEPLAAECATNHQVLALVPTPLDGTADASISVPVPEAGRWWVTLRVAQKVVVPHVAPFTLTGPQAQAKAALADQTFEWTTNGLGCLDLPAREITLAPPSATLVLSARGGPIALDNVTLRRVK